MIIHMDLDCFFVSAERTRSPFLKGKPVVVCKSGDTKIFSTHDMPSMLTEGVGGFNGMLHHQKTFQCFHKEAWREEFIDEKGQIHGIVIAKSYEAKRYGIQTGMRLQEALLRAPSLLIVPSDHLFYQQLSLALKAFLQSKIPLLEQYSIDEFWGDLKGWVRDEETYAFMAHVQKEVLERFDLPLSIGASRSKWIAKLATDFNKPYGLTLVPQEKIAAFVAPMKIASFPGIGKVLQKKFASYAIETLGEVLEHEKLVMGFGKIGRDLIARLRGEDNEPVIANRNRHSVGISRNFAAIHAREEVLRRAIILSRHLSYTIEKLALRPTTYAFSLRYETGVRVHTSQTIERVFSETLYRQWVVKTLLSLDAHTHYGITHISLSLSNFISPSHTKTFSLLHVNTDEKAKRLSEKLTHLRDMYGIDIVRSGAEKRHH
ncbi:DNA polymerase Y family protein [Sulfurospirillum barnesii]|uniref:Nucleotidyltransferase/DNA polymerase involved in DNA repair n=1 Tax=Sulfurospirillum barnesii (strain ATCC 700032 / DSM 10660 / SES-3) TaxID=760154 RepID=I3XZU3_SULBS|nr:DNA polymerase IV [Sulfurospirillum barnesii]AFL69467.1 nucleotidyltransferase/DNA polymerase involved in DNA repair [Sulfurospirillum barnesii SES-3]